jgi:hypothetical protein
MSGEAGSRHCCRSTVPDPERGPVPLVVRRCLQGILFELYAGLNWKHLPTELGFGSV